MLATKCIQVLLHSLSVSYVCMDGAINSGIGLYRLHIVLSGTGGLAMVTEACAIFGAICAQTQQLPLRWCHGIPEMRKYKYDDSLSTASALPEALGHTYPAQLYYWYMVCQHSSRKNRSLQEQSWHSSYAVLYAGYMDVVSKILIWHRQVKGQHWLRN